MSLSLNTDNFTRNIRSVGRQIQEAESSFRLASAGVEHFEQSAVGLQSRLDMLQRKLTLQNDVVGQYQRALAQASERLTECHNRQNDYSARLEQARTRQQSLQDAVNQATAAYNHYRDTLGETDSVTIAAKDNMEAAQQEYAAASEDVRRLAGQQNALQRATQNAADAFSTGQRNLNNAQAAVRQTEADIRSCNRELRLAQTDWSAAGERIRETETAITSLSKQMALAESRFTLAAAGIRDMDANAGALSAKLTMLRDKLTLQQQAVDQYTEKLQAARDQLAAVQEAGDPDQVREATDAVTDAEAALNRAQTAVRETNAAIAETNRHLRTAQSSWTAAGRSLESYAQSCDKVSQTTAKIGRVLMTTFTTPIAALGTAAVKASIDFESAFTSVRKTVDATEDEFGRLEQTVKTMSTQIAADTTAIADVMAAAGQLGIRNDALEGFTRVMIDLGNSTDIVAQNAASTLAKFANIMSMDQSQFSNLGSTLVELGNNYATTESAIMEMSMRLAGAGKQVGLSEAQILGFATALSSVGIEAQMGGSALSKALVKMEVAAATGGDALKDFSAVCGVTQKQFVAMWKADPAAVFQLFIESLARMDDEGISAIAVLDEIGISEVRLRDTLLRSVNATELFSSAQQTATRAWRENTALAEEAGKRYATTESRMINLKNKAMLFAQTLGDDLTPAVHQLIGGADEYLDRLMQMDEAERMQLIRTAAIVASIGPAFLLLSKLNKGISVVSGGIGRFATAVGTAGGGFKGFMSVLGKSPMLWTAVTVAVIAGTVALVDYASGAKMAREALEGMEKTAREWKETAADTFYGSSRGLSFFGMSTEDFTKGGREALLSSETWLRELLTVWSDGKKETNAIVNQYTDSFRAGTASIRDSLKEMRQNAKDSGYTGLAGQMASDLKTLDSLDAEIAKLLKRKQNKLFTPEDQVRLQELIDTREAIAIKYNLVPADTGAEGFDTIRQKVEAEVARAQARGQKDAGAAVYENAMVAAAQGMAAVNRELDEQYDREYALIQLMTDEGEKQTAMSSLNQQYNEDRRAAALEYAALMRDMILPVWNQEDIQQAGADMDTLMAKLAQFSTASDSEKPQLLKDLNELTSGMDEGALTEYIGLLTQIQSLLDSGMTTEEVSVLFPEIDFTGALEQIAAIQTFLHGREGMLPGLASIFSEAVPEEMLKIATDLDMTGAQARWNEFAQNPGAITTDAIIVGLQAAEGQTPPSIAVNAFVDAFTVTDPETAKTSLTPTGLVAYVAKYAEVTNGADVSGLTPEVAEALVAGYTELASGADVSKLTPTEIVAYVSAYAEEKEVDLSGLSPQSLTAFVMAYEEVTGGALTTALTPSDIAAIVTQYLKSENVDLSQVNAPEIDALVTSYAEATNCDKTSLKAEVVAQITAYQEAENVTKPSFVTTQVSITGYDLQAYRRLVRENPVEVQGIVRLGSTYQNPGDALLDPDARFWRDGVEVPAEMVTGDMLTPDKVAVLDQDGTMHILLTPELSGDQAVIETLRHDVAEVDSLGLTTLGKAAGLLPVTIIDRVTSAVGRLKSYEKTKDYGWVQKFWATLCGESTDKRILDTSMQLDFDPDTLSSLTSYVSEMVTAIQNGDQIAAADFENLKSIAEFLRGLELTGVGENVTAGIGEAMAAAGWETDAESVAGNLENALKAAFIIQSPSKRMHPVGDNVSAGIGKGAADHDFTTDAADVAEKLKAAISDALTQESLAVPGLAAMSGLAEGMLGYSMVPAAATVGARVRSAMSAAVNKGTLRSIGVNAMSGLAAGIHAGQSGVVTAMCHAVKAAVAAAKTTLKIRSPSVVFQDEVGRQAMRGIGRGFVLETKAQARTVSNAARYLKDTAKESAISPMVSQNSRTYNASSSVSLSGNNFYVRDEHDIYALATEIAALTKRQQRGMGLRFA